MGSFANSVFNLLMGWLRTAALAVWGLISGQGGSDFFIWLGENWLALTIGICVVCTVIDMLIHIIRWRPYKVWASFFRRISGHDRRQAKRMLRQEAAMKVNRAEHEPVEEEWIYPDSDVQQENADEPQRLTPEEEQAAYRSRFARPAEQPIAYRRPAEMRRLQYQAINTDNREELLSPEGYPQPAAEAPEEQTKQHTIVPMPLQEEQPRESLSHQMRRRMTQLQKNLGITENEEELVYRPAQPVVDKEEMYHAPVYPPDWKQQQATQVTPRRRRQHSEINTDA